MRAKHAPSRRPDPQQRWYNARLRDMHDLWHVVTGYGRDSFGEACLLAFSYAQTRNRGIAFIAFFGTREIARELGCAARGAQRWKVSVTAVAPRGCLRRTGERCSRCRWIRRGRC